MALTDNVYVINLDRSKDRWDDMIAQQHILQRPFIRIPAVDGKLMTPERRANVSSPICNRLCTDTMIGIFMSHKLAWETILKNGDKCAIVFEDDCIISPDATSNIDLALNELNAHDQDWDILYLGNSGAANPQQKYPWLTRFVLNFASHLNRTPFFLGNQVYVPELPLGLHGYIVSRNGARHLLNELQLASYHIDFEIVRHSENLKLYATKKTIANQTMSPQTSTQIGSNFPALFNNVLVLAFDSDHSMYSNFLSAPFCQISGIRVSPYLLFTIVFCVLIPISWTFWVNSLLIAWLVFELRLNISEWSQIITYLISIHIILYSKYYIGTL